MMTERGAYEIAIDGTTRTYLDREDIAQQAAARLKQINPNSKITLRDLQTGTVTVVKHPSRAGDVVAVACPLFLR
jgi:hypothetical protein